MNLRDQLIKNWLGGTIGALLAVLAGLGCRFIHFGQDVPLGQNLIDRSYDLPFTLRGDLDASDAVIVYIDEESHRQLNQPVGFAWDRALHAQLLSRLKEAGARVVVMDILFFEPGDESVDQGLASALKGNGRVVIGALYERVGQEGAAAGWSVIRPAEVFGEAAAGLGLVNLLDDPDYCIRRIFPGARGDNNPFPSLATKAAEIWDPAADHARFKQNEEPWLNYFGPPGTTPGRAPVIKSIPYYLALRPEGVPPDFFKDKAVFVGQPAGKTGFIGDNKDAFRSPYTQFTRSFSSGVEVHATGFLNIIHENWLTRLPWYAEFTLLIVLGGVFGFGLAQFAPLLTAGLAIGASTAVAVLGYTLVTSLNVWFGWLIVAAVQIPVAFTWSVLFNSFKLFAQKRMLEQSLALHLSPARVKQILKSPALLRPGAEKQEISILFSDIANFSKITGRMEPGDLFRQLNNYFEAALGCIHRTDGTVVKLIGDAIFAIWNAPFAQQDQQHRACLAALKLRDQLFQFDAQQHGLPMRTRVGLHHGPAYVGNVGSSTRFDYTAIGDSINLASRLEGLNKTLGTDILASREIQKTVENDLVSRLVGHFRVKGFDRVVEVHELIGTNDQKQESEAWRDAFSHALFHFQRKLFDQAETGFRKAIELRKQDGPSEFYLRQIDTNRTTPPPEDWSGEVDITEK